MAGRCGIPIVPPFTVMGIERDGEIVGGVVFNNYTRHDVHMTVAGFGWSRGFVREVGRYVFGRLGCRRITVITEQPKVVALAERLGGKVEGLLREHFGDGRPGYLVGILKEDWTIR